MYNDYLQGRLANIYWTEKMAVARREQLLKMAAANQPARHHRFLAWSGDRLIALGWSLKERYEEAPVPALTELLLENGVQNE